MDTTPKDLFDFVHEPSVTALSPTVRRVVTTAAEIMEEAPDRVDFLHAVLCQVGMPRKRQEARIFERSSGTSSMILEAGRLWTRQGWKEQPLPYGTRPRLVMVHISGEAVRKQTRHIEVGGSMRDFLEILGIETNGGARGGYTMFKKQMEALAACRLILGMSLEGRDITLNTQPISRFEAWLQQEGTQRSMWPGVLELSQEFYDTLVEHAVPLDARALGALQHSSLNLDIYTWLAHRLFRVRKPGGVKVTWGNLQGQFGQEYHSIKDFKKEFRQALAQVLTVYPSAQVEQVSGGFLLRPSLPPVHRTTVPVSGTVPANAPRSLPAPSTSAKHLKSKTIERFRALYPRLDVYACQGDFDAWLLSKEKTATHYDRAFLGFAKKWIKGGI